MLPLLSPTMLLIFDFCVSKHLFEASSAARSSHLFQQVYRHDRVFDSLHVSGYFHLQSQILTFRISSGVYVRDPVNKG